ncbi:MAG TPA: hypothetical protein VN628_12940 [Vicinamibacterales bacterium]|nr:hypothetical protein [Vicinamibacterales bacterium]
MDDCRRRRRARRLISTVVAFATIVFPRLTFAQRFDEAGVRAQGMAGAFVAVADDASATWWNPAGLATGLSVADFSIAGGDQGNRQVAFAFPSLGLSYYRYRINDISRKDNGAVSQFGATFGQSIAPWLVVATTVKLMNAQSDTQADLDVGAMASFGVMRFGVTVRDLRNPTFGAGLDALEVSRRARAGAAVTVPGRGALDQFVFDVDGDLNKAIVAGREEQDVTGGVESWWLGRRLGIRGGGGTGTTGGGGSFGAFGLTVTPYPHLNIDGAVTRGADSARDRWSLGLRLTF